MVEKVHAVDPLQYVLTLLADLTHDERNVVLLVKTAQGSVNPTSHVLPLKLHGYTCVFAILCRDKLYRPLLGVFHKNDKDKYSKHQVNQTQRHVLYGLLCAALEQAL